MKKLRLLLSFFLLCVGANVARAGDYESYTDGQGIEYQFYSDYSGTYARILSINSSASTLTIPDKVTSSVGRVGVVTGFSSSFTCSCPNLTSLIIKESTYRGVVAGDFWGMSKLNHIYFHDPNNNEPSTGLSWRLDPNTIFNLLNGKVIVHLSQLVEPLVYGARLTYNPNESYLNVIQSWKSHNQVEEVRCNFKGGSIGTDGYEFGVAPFTGSNYDIFSSPSPYEAALLYINKYATTAYIPKYVSIVTDYVPQNWKITRFGYPGITTDLECTKLTTLTFAGNITIDKGVIFDNCFNLEKIVFNGNADIQYLNTSPYTSFTTPLHNLKEIEFHGDAVLGSSLFRLTNLEKVYFYGNIPDHPGGLASLENLTVYVDLDIYEIAEWKQSHSSWSSINMQPIDPSSSYRKVTINNPGEGTFKVQYYHDGILTMVTIKPNSTKTIEVDKGKYIYTTDFSLPETSNYRLSGFVFNETTSLPLGYGVAVNEKTNTLAAHYRQLTFPIGTPLDIHFTKVGDGDMVFRTSDENEWALIDPENDEWLELHDMSHDGEEYNYTITYYDQMDLDISFSCLYNKPVNGIREECIVIVNGVPEPIESWQLTEDDYGFCADYSVHIDGDMEIQIIHQNNGRNLSVVNGDGGTIALYREGETEPELVSTIDNGTSYEQVLPKDTAHYAVITPVNGKEVFALFVNKPLSETARLQLDASQYLQEDGTYRVPLSGFADGKDTYRLTVLYVDRPSYAFNIAVVGDGSLKCTPFREEDGDIQAISEVTASESEGRNKTVKAYYDEIGETGYVEFWLTAPKEGETVKVYMDGVDVSDKFMPKENMGNQLRGVIASVPKDDYLGVLSSVSMLAVYEDNKDEITWKASMIGNTGTIESADIVVAGGDAEIDLGSTMHDGTTTFNMAEIGTNLVVGITAEAGKQVRMLFNGEDYTNLFSVTTENGRDYYSLEGNDLTQFFVDGNWIFNIMKKSPDIIEFADAEVKRICVANWDTDGDGELSKAEAAAVETLKKDNGDGTFGDPVFKGNTNITSFEEFQFFTGLTSVEEYAFSSCRNLTSVIVPKNVETTQNYAFSGCRNLSITLPEGLTKLGPNTFNGCYYMKEIRLPESLTTIDRQVFYDCYGLKSLFIPKNVTSINVFNSALSSTYNLISISVDPENTTYDSRKGCNAIITTATNYMVYGCQNTVIPEDVTQLYGFWGQRNLKSIVIPKSVTSITAYAFIDCTNLTSVVAKGVTPPTLNTDAFKNISANCVLTVPYGTRDAYIAAGWTTDVFKGGIVEEEPASDIITFADAEVKRICVANWDTDHDDELSKAEAAAVTTLKVDGNSVFRGNTTITSFDELQYFSELIELPDNAFLDCQNLKSVILPSKLRDIGNNAFYRCYSLTSLNLPESVQRIYSYVFYKAPLKTLYIPKNVWQISDPVLGDCSTLVSITVDPDNQTFDSRDGSNAIYHTTDNKLIGGSINTVIPEGVVSLDNAFYEHVNLKSIVIPSTVTSIATSCFYGCSKLTSVVSKRRQPVSIGEFTFKNISANCVLTVPYGTRDAYIAAGWTTDIFKGGVVEDKSQFDTNGDSSVSIADVTTLVNVILGKPIQ